MRIFVLCLFIFLSACAEEKEYRFLQGEMLGTTLNLKAKLSRREAVLLQQELLQLDRQMKAQMSIFNPKSMLSRINRGEDIKLTPWMKRNIRLADSVSRLSGGIYDITVAPLVEAYGFARKDFDPSREIKKDSLLQFVGYEKIKIEGDKLIKTDPRVQLDLNSIAKGFAVDLVAEQLENLGCEDYMVDIGGELRISGVNPSGAGWTIGVETPRDGNFDVAGSYEVALSLTPESEFRALATSGNYRRFHLGKDGEKVVHTINPQTGEAQASSLLSVTVIAPSCAEADAYATMLLAAGDTKAESLAAKIENCEFLFIYLNRYKDKEGEEYRIVRSQGMEQFIVEDAD